MLTFLRNIQLEQPLAMKKSLFIVLALALLNCGCSTISLVYRNADWYLQHKIYGYTTFTSQQKETIRKEITDYMTWHRKDALPEYIIFLQNLNGAAQYAGQLKAEEVALLREHLINLYQISLAPAISPAAKILGTLDSRQIHELEKNLARENQQQLNEQLEVSREVYLNKRADKTVNFLEWLAGDLGARQEQEVRDMSRHLPVVSDIYIRHRQENQGRLIALLNGHAGEEKIAAFLSSWLFTPEETRSPEQQRAIQAFEQASDDMIAHIQGKLTVPQKEHMHKMVSSYIDDMRAEIAASRQDSGH
jgi:hypothetical protein